VILEQERCGLAIGRLVKGSRWEKAGIGRERETAVAEKIVESTESVEVRHHRKVRVGSLRRKGALCKEGEISKGTTTATTRS
jgi:hypothetical protein